MAADVLAEMAGMPGLIIFCSLLAVGLTMSVFLLLLHGGMQWGASSDERNTPMPGDAFLDGGPRSRVVMTRAISIQAAPELVWPWLAQLGRGAGFYSIDALDNGGRRSARHIVSWIPAPQLGDATAIGYLRHIEPGRSLVWWAGGLRFAGAWARLVTDVQLIPEGDRSRLVIRMSADASGPTAALALLVFAVIDSIMARRQLIEIRRRAEHYAARSADPTARETGGREQYQLYEVIYASGERAGDPGREHAEQWRAAAIKAGLLAK